VNAGTLWAGGLAAALVAALAYVVGIVVTRGLFDIPMLAPATAGILGDGSTWSMAATAFVAGLLATALIHLLLIATPRPFKFFGRIVGLLTVLATVLPFTQDAELSAQVATATINLIVGTAIGSLVSGVAARSLRPPSPSVPGPRPAQGTGTGPGYSQPYGSQPYGSQPYESQPYGSQPYQRQPPPTYGSDENYPR
jgi:hypothetical protein